jgi:ABC-2 type transport system ATP-binding protein
VVVLNAGRLVTTGTLRELQTAATRVRASEPLTLAGALLAAGALVEPVEADLLIVRGLPIETIGELALRSGVALRELAPDTSSLEELFLGWTGGPTPMDTHVPLEVPS